MSATGNAKTGSEMEWLVHECGRSVCCEAIISSRSKGVSFSLKDTPVPHAVIDMDKISWLTERKCDFMVLAVDIKRTCKWIVPVEVSGGKSKKATIIEGQLQSSAQLAGRHIDNDHRATVLPVFVGNIREAAELNRKRVEYFGRSYPIRILRPGESIAKLMPSAMVNSCRGLPADIHAVFWKYCIN